MPPPGHTASPPGDDDLKSLLAQAIQTLMAQPNPAAGLQAVHIELVKLNGKMDNLTARVDRLERDVEDSETTEADELRRERDELRESRKHWTRYVVTALVSLITGACLLAIGRVLR